MAECPDQPPDTVPESDQTEADSEFRADNSGDERQCTQEQDGDDVEKPPETRDPTTDQGASNGGLERTESSGNVRDEVSERGDPGDLDKKIEGELLAVDDKTPDSASSDDIQCLAEEDRDSVTDSSNAQAAAGSQPSTCESESHSDQADAEKDIRPTESFHNPEMSQSQEAQSESADADTDLFVPLASLDAELPEPTAQTESNGDETQPEAKEIDNMVLLETDQPECDINSDVETSEGQGGTGPEGTVDQQSEDAQLSPMNNTNNSCLRVTNEELAAAPNIPRVSSQGTIGQIQNSVQALIDKTSGFLDSDPPSTMSSMSDLDQAGLDALSSSSRVFDSIRFDTPSPGASSPQHFDSATSQAANVQSLTASPEASSSFQQQRIEQPTSHDDNFVPAISVVKAEDGTQVASNKESGNTEEDLLSQLDEELNTNAAEAKPAQNISSVEDVDSDNPNGLMQRTVCLEQIPEYKRLLSECETFRKRTEEQQQRIKSLQEKESRQSEQIDSITNERDSLKANLESLQGKSTDEINQAQVKEMESTIAQQTKELMQTREKLASHDSAAKRAVQTLQNELKKRVDEITKLYEETKKEKDAMVMKYAMAEQKSIEASDKMARCEGRMREVAREREVMIQRFTQLKKNREMAIATLEARNKDVAGMKRHIEMTKETISSQETKTKLTQNKLELEENAHKETKAKLEELTRKLNEQREEALILRKDCQAMIKTYQESEEIKSNSLDHELKKKESELQQQLAAKSEVQEVHAMLRKELESLKVKHKDMIAELKTYKDKVQCLETERRHQEKSLDAFKETLQSQKQNNEVINSRMLELEFVEEEVISVKERNTKLVARNDELEQSNKDLQAEMDGCARREQEHLEFTQKISEKNSSLQSENNRLNIKVEGLTAELERLSGVGETLEKKCSLLEKDLQEEKNTRKEEYEIISTRLAEKSRAAEQLTIDLDDQRDENKTIKRRHTSNVKDLTRQLQQAKKKLEVYENKETGKDSTSMGSRTSSTTSLETANNQNGGVSKSPTEPNGPEMQEYPEVRVIEVDKQMLIEKIVKLQKAHARKSEKIEFMDDHINQLLEEVKKKAKIIQMYALREESGTLVPESVDNNKELRNMQSQCMPGMGIRLKAALAKKTGIMASLYSVHQQDGSMTLELSLEINKKLQAVLEDTLLKNITIKDNLETLGQEIARLSQENRQLQLEIQALRKS